MSQARTISVWMTVGLVLALPGCTGSPARQDKQNVQEARSLLAEWAMIARLHQAGRLNDTYYREMRAEAEKQLTALIATAPKSGTAAGQAIAQVAQVHGEPPLAMVRARADAAQAIENGLEGR